MGYNKEQQAAIDCQDSRIVVVAPPGAGKTWCMIGAIRKYVSENPKDRVIAITFTKKAALELQNKLYNTNVDSATIHSWSLKELNKLGAKHKFKVSLLQDAQIQEILLKLCKQCGYYTLNQYLLFAYIVGSYNLDVSEGTKNKFKKVLASYIQWKRANSLYDFTDLPLYLYDMLNLYEERITDIQGLFVDEFQDVDEIQAKIFTMVDAKKFFYIGDPDQSIYTFRGATPENIDNLTDFTKMLLIQNYRSYQPIIDFSTQIRSGMSRILDINHLEDGWIRCVRTDGEGEVYTIDCDECHDLVHNTMRDPEQILTDFMLRKPYILCRANKQVKAIQANEYMNVSTIHQAKGLEYPYVIVIDMELAGEEETNIAYVGCTRAQNGLLVIDYLTFMAMLPNIMYEYSNEIKGGKLF